MRIIILFVLSAFFLQAKGQDSTRFFHPDSLRQTVSFLASDELRGRASFTKDIDKAAAYISGEFHKSGIPHLDIYPNHLQPFIDLDPSTTLVLLKVDKETASPTTYYYNSSFYFMPDLKTNDFHYYSLASIPERKIIDHINHLIDTNSTSLFITIPENQKEKFAFIKKKEAELKIPGHTLVICITDNEKPEVEIGLSPRAKKGFLFNVIGILPGRKYPKEIVIISSHYDHVGVGSSLTDSIFNGANDNASGTAAMLSFAKYFADKKDNARTIMFVAFSGEEIGLKGSIFLSNNVDASKIVTVFNLEMLGKAGNGQNKSLIITEPVPGKSDLNKIMNRYCKDIKILNDRNPTQRLFFRSDNSPFSSKGIPAHTFMCFTNDDPTYHQPTDEVSTLDFNNMSALVKGLLPGIEAVVSGKETPKNK